MLQKGRTAVKTAARILWQNKAIVILLVLLGGILIITAPDLSFTAGGQALIGIVREPNAYCTFTEINSNDSTYGVVITDGYPNLIAALKEDKLDAAILPVQYLDELHDDKISVLAATSYLNLVVVENGDSIYSLADLNGRSVLIPESLANSLECKMLNLLISKADIQVNILYENDESITKRVQEHHFEVMILRPYQSAQVLLEGGTYRSCFNLAEQWYSLLGTQPPLGCLIAARNTAIDAKASGFINLLAGVKASISFINDKHKKAATLIAESGLGEDTVTVMKAIPHYLYTYLDGSSLADSLEQLKIVQTNP